MLSQLLSEENVQEIMNKLFYFSHILLKDQET